MADEVNETPEMTPQPTEGLVPQPTEEMAPQPSGGLPTPPAEEPAADTESLAAGLNLGGEAEEAGEESEVIAAPVVIRGHLDKFGVAWGTGRRKSSVARVRVREGNGNVTINGRPLDEYFHVERDRHTVGAPLEATSMTDSVDVIVNVKGGGTTGQAGAIMLGVARALQVMNPELHETLSAGHYLTRDSRMVERKKYGLKKARKSFQFSKR
ncbi:30S ribosomal protein S9 [Symmachiella dynata]|uniref:30S ribosomal protein S9 n=1 Tax=Symmachiella dynata TaxID=2527995 RepID=UPI003C6F6B86